MNRREFLAGSLMLLTGCHVPGERRTNNSRGGSSVATVDRPNIIFILADDLGYGDIGAYGQTKIRTPNLDRMAAEGMKFTAHYSGSNVCAPSRCSLLSGKHTGHAYIRDNRGGAGK